jgi:hypothetical protein
MNKENLTQEAAQDILFDNQGEFSIWHDEQIVSVMFYNDYRKKFALTQYEFEKREKQGQLKRLRIHNRKRLDSVVVIASEKEIESENDFISDESGAFKIVVKNTGIFEVMFVSEFTSAFDFASMQAVHYHLNFEGRKNSSNLQHNISKVTIKRFGSNQDVILVAIHNKKCTKCESPFP